MAPVDPNAPAGPDAAPVAYTLNHLALSARDPNGLVPPMELRDGSVWSIQASPAHLSYWPPALGYWSEVEVMVARGAAPDSWGPFLVAAGLYGHVPVGLVDREIAARGIKAWRGPIAND